MQKNKTMTIYAAKVRENKANCRYPTRIDLVDEEAAIKAFSYDTVFAEYRNNYRSKDNFVRSNVIPFDCDNDHSDAPGEWIAEDDIAAFFSEVSYVIHYSRHHMKQKGKRSARPRFHILFLIDEITDATAYTDLKKRVNDIFPYFDDKALDAARFFFGTENPKVNFHRGAQTLNAFLEDYESSKAFEEYETLAESIPEGSRNKTMHLTAVRLLKRYGDNEKAYTAYMTASDKCSPPLEQTELDTIWNSARRFYKDKVATSEGYIPPDVYNAPPAWEAPIPFDEYALPPFPVDALPPVLRDYVKAVSETTQTAPDMAGAASLAIFAICTQGKTRIFGKSDWAEPLNLFVVIIAAPAERKSAVMSLMTAPLEEYEQKSNSERDADIIESEMKLAVLDSEKRSLEDKVSKGKAPREELKSILFQPCPSVTPS